MPQFKHFDDTEKALLKQWSQEGTAPSVIATRLGRSLSAVVRQLRALSSKKKAKAVGRPRKLTEKQIDMLVQKTAAHQGSRCEVPGHCGHDSQSGWFQVLQQSLAQRASRSWHLHAPAKGEASPHRAE